MHCVQVVHVCGNHKSLAFQMMLRHEFCRSKRGPFTMSKLMRSAVPKDYCSPKDKNYGELWGIMVNYGFFGEIMRNYGELWGIMGFYGDVCATKFRKTFIHIASCQTATGGGTPFIKKLKCPK